MLSLFPLQIVDGLNPAHLKLVNAKLEVLNPPGNPFDNQPSNLLGYPNQFLGPVLQCSLITLLRDTITCCRHGEWVWFKK